MIARIGEYTVVIVTIDEIVGSDINGYLLFQACLEYMPLFNKGITTYYLDAVELYWYSPGNSDEYRVQVAEQFRQFIRESYYNLYRLPVASLYLYSIDVENFNVLGIDSFNEDMYRTWNMDKKLLSGDHFIFKEK